VSVHVIPIEAQVVNGDPEFCLMLESASKKLVSCIELTSRKFKKRKRLELVMATLQRGMLRAAVIFRPVAIDMTPVEMLVRLIGSPVSLAFIHGV